MRAPDPLTVRPFILAAHPPERTWEDLALLPSQIETSSCSVQSTHHSFCVRVYFLVLECTRLCHVLRKYVCRGFAPTRPTRFPSGERFEAANGSVWVEGQCVSILRQPPARCVPARVLRRFRMLLNRWESCAVRGPSGTWRTPARLAFVSSQVW